MPFLTGTLARYFGLRFLSAVLVVFAGIFALVTLLDYIEMMRRAGDIPNVSAVLVAKTSIFRVPQVVERILPFCVLIGAMSCYLNLSRRLELVVARSSGLSAWQFMTPALVVAFVLGIVATTIYNPLSAILQERSKHFEAELFRQTTNAPRQSGGTFWVSQRTDDGQAIINAVSSRDQGINLNGDHCQVGLLRSDRVRELVGVAHLGHDPEAAVRQDPDHPLADHHRVVGDDRPQLGHVTGIDAWTVVPPVTVVFTSNSPPSADTRSASPRSPVPRLGSAPPVPSSVIRRSRCPLV